MRILTKKLQRCLNNLSELQKLRVVVINLEKQTKDSVSKIWNNFKNCIEYSHLQSHKDVIDPIVEECHTLIKEFQRDIEYNKQIIRRFDEVLLEKANKFDIEKINKHMKTLAQTSEFEIYKLHVIFLFYYIYSKEKFLKSSTNW